MSSIWRQVVICIRLYWIWSQVSADGEILDSNVKLTWNESRKYCEDNGKVLFDAKKNDYEASLRKILKDTNQAWVSARVEYSHVVNMPVCIATSKPLGPKKSFDTDIIGNCLKFCNGHLYAGLKDKDCYCFNESSSLPRSMRCNYTCNNDPFHQCGGNESISLYEKVNKTITQHIVNGCKECVYARATRGFANLFTESCVGHGANSAICEAGSDAACINNSWTVGSEQLCRMNRVDSLRWKQAKQNCADIGGHLISSKIPSSTMLANLTYWLGFYRIPMIHKVNEPLALELVTNDMCCAVARREGDLMLIEGDDCRAKHAIICQELELVTNDTCCAVARREGDLVLIEGDDCHAEHAFICQDDSLERSSASPQSTEKPIPGERSNSEPTDGKIIYGVVAVSSILLVALVITAFVCIFRRRQVSQERANGSATHSTRDQRALLEKQITNPPSKPSRKAHTNKENLESSYENVTFVRGRQDVTIHQLAYSSFEYDKINLDKAHIQENDYKDGDTHVYDHGSLHRTEEQYDVMNMPGVMTPIMDETYDRTTL